VANSTFDMWVMLVFGVIGYLMRKTGYDPGPMALAIVLGPLLESSFRQSMLMSSGSLGIFIERPVALIGLLAIAAVIGLRVVLGRKKVFQSLPSDS
jgi:putative tricarboxylic transport membrane protein